MVEYDVRYVLCNIFHTCTDAHIYIGVYCIDSISIDILIFQQNVANCSDNSGKILNSGKRLRLCVWTMHVSLGVDKFALTTLIILLNYLILQKESHLVSTKTETASISDLIS